MKPRLSFYVLAASLMWSAAPHAQSIPHVTAKSLNGKVVTLPADFAGKPAVLIVGFSKAGGEQCGPFARRLAKEQPGPVGHGLLIYQIAMLESAPRLIRGLIVHGIRGGVPQGAQDRFLPLFEDENQWKQVAGFTRSDEKDAYLLLVDPDGTVRWRGHGPYSETLYNQLIGQLEIIKLPGQ
ncbi:MAG TPA: hypothetical protein VGF06_02720 [Terriglobales bacterium]|jgi:hypothetical protein